MKHIDLFISEDGEEFEDKEECALYEFKLKVEQRHLKDRIKFYDGVKGGELDITNPHDLESVWVIIAKDENALREMNEAYFESELDELYPYMPEPISVYDNYYPIGVFVYQEEDREWHNLTTQLEEIQDQLNYWRNVCDWVP